MTAKFTTRMSKATRDRYRAVLSLPDEGLRAINSWIRDNMDVFGEPITRPAKVETAHEALGVSRPEFFDAIAFLSTILISGDVPASAAIDSFVEELREIGFGPAADKARLLLEGIEITQRDAELIRQRGLVLHSGVPVLHAADALCDLRAVFRRLPSPSTSRTHLEGVQVLLALEPVVILSFELHDATGNDSSSLFQLTEAGLRNLLKTLQEALSQLEIVKNARPPMAPPEEGRNGA